MCSNGFPEFARTEYETPNGNTADSAIEIDDEVNVEYESLKRKKTKQNGWTPRQEQLADIEERCLPIREQQSLWMGKDMTAYNAERKSVAPALTEKSGTYLKIRSEPD
jgi:hypothetical protein